jgi:hypothetical protein
MKEENIYFKINILNLKGTYYGKPTLTPSGKRRSANGCLVWRYRNRAISIVNSSPQLSKKRKIQKPSTSVDDSNENAVPEGQDGLY